MTQKLRPYHAQLFNDHEVLAFNAMMIQTHLSNTGMVLPKSGGISHPVYK